LAARPGDPFLLTLYGEGLRRNRQFPEAEQALRSAIEADADQFEPYLNLGVLLAEQGRFAEAVKMFREALSIDPANQPAAGNLKLAVGQAGSLPPSKAR
jgi:Flp pilus assembly protein TadD